MSWSNCIVGLGLGSLALVVTACGTSKYIQKSKEAEAKATVMSIARAASSAFEREKMGTAVLVEGAPAKVEHSLCASAANTVPASAASIKAMKYQSSPSEWGGTADTGWKCLGFSLDTPQYYMYGYTASGTNKKGDSFRATARGDLDGDGKLSTFELSGEVGAGDAVMIAPAIKETDPDE